MALLDLIRYGAALSLLLRTLLTLLILVVTSAVLALHIRPHLSSLHFLRGPKSTSLLTGCWEEALAEEPGVAYTRWAEIYGGAVRVASFLGEDRLMLTDPAGVQHVMKECYSYPKPPEVRGPLSRILGKGLQHAEGDDHRRQKKIVSPAFSTTHLRDLTPTFFDVAHKLRDQWLELIESGSVEAGVFKNPAAAVVFKKQDGETVVDALKWLSRAALDIVGLAGFGHPFNTLFSSSDALGAAFSHMLSSTFRQTARIMLAVNLAGKLISALPFGLSAWIPVEAVRRIRRGFETMENETGRILEGKKEEARGSGVGLGLGIGQERKDLMMLMLKSNLEDAKMSDEELAGQMTTMVLAGSETTAATLAWALHTLADRPEMAQQLREEVKIAQSKARDDGREELSYDEVDHLPVLDAICREILRLHPPLPYTLRQASRSDTIPLSSPIVTSSGQLLQAIPVKKGTVVNIPIYAMNRSKEVYGEDAELFKLDRWLEEGGGKVGGTAGAWGGQVTFWGGPRACIGLRFALLEMKVILAVLLSTFNFLPRDADIQLEHRAGAITRPIVLGEEELGCRMPLRVRVLRD